MNSGRRFDAQLPTLACELVVENRTVLAHTAKLDYLPLCTGRMVRVLALHVAARGRLGPVREDVAALCAEAGQ